MNVIAAIATGRGSRGGKRRGRGIEPPSPAWIDGRISRQCFHAEIGKESIAHKCATSGAKRSATWSRGRCRFNSAKIRSGGRQSLLRCHHFGARGKKLCGWRGMRFSLTAAAFECCVKSWRWRPGEYIAKKCVDGGLWQYTWQLIRFAQAIPASVA